MFGPGILQNWPPESSRAWGLAKDDADDDDGADFDPHACKQIADSFISWAPCILEHAERQGEAMLTRHMLEANVLTLRSWSRALWVAHGIVSSEKTEGDSNFLHSSLQLWQCISMSRGLKGGPAALKQILLDSMRIAVPKNFCDAFVESIESPLSSVVPSPSTIARANLPVDIALCLYERDRWDDNKPTYRYAWSDSSPMAGYDWLWSQFKEISKEWVVPLWRAACKVQLDAEGIIDGIDAEEDQVDALEEFAETHREQFDVLKRHVRLVVDPPVSLASGHRALVHKVSGQVFSE